MYTDTLLELVKERNKVAIAADNQFVALKADGQKLECIFLGAPWLGLTVRMKGGAVPYNKDNPEHNKTRSYRRFRTNIYIPDRDEKGECGQVRALELSLRAFDAFTGPYLTAQDPSGLFTIRRRGAAGSPATRYIFEYVGPSTEEQRACAAEQPLVDLTTAVNQYI